jgi:uncharacterized FlaG/YvyC family protein
MSIQLHASQAGTERPSQTTGIVTTPPARVDDATDAAKQAQQDEKTKLYAVPEDRAETTPMRPPSEVLEEMQRASERYDELKAQQRELRFAADPSTNRVIVEVRDLDGNVLKTIPPSKALEIISGGALD